MISKVLEQELNDLKMVVVGRMEEEPEHLMRVIDETGDSKLIWDSANEAEVEAARKLFNELKGKRYKAFSVKKDGEPGSVITSFDPNAEKIIMQPPMAGG